MSEATARARQGWAKDFMEHRFWVSVFRPYLVAMRNAAIAQLATCELRKIHEVRANVKVTDAIIGFPDAFLSGIELDVSLERKQEFEEEAAAAEHEPGSR
jgi:hypothetical protein